MWRKREIKRVKKTVDNVVKALGSWYEYLLPLILLRRDELLPLTKLPTYFMHEYSADISLWFASFVVITMPVLILYLFLQKYFISGLTEGAIK